MLKWLTGEPFTAKPVVIERPALSDRSTVEARLLGFGTDPVVAAYRAWRITIDDLEDERTNIERNVGQDGRDPNQPLERSYIESFRDRLAPQEKARQRLIDAIAKDLNSRAS